MEFNPIKIRWNLKFHTFNSYYIRGYRRYAKYLTDSLIELLSQLRHIINLVYASFG